MSEEFKVFDDIARFVLGSEHGGLLKAFADAWLRADPDNKQILRSAWAHMIVKYDLNAEYAEWREGAEKFGLSKGEIDEALRKGVVE